MTSDQIQAIKESSTPPPFGAWRWSAEIQPKEGERVLAVHNGEVVIAGYFGDHWKWQDAGDKPGTVWSAESVHWWYPLPDVLTDPLRDRAIALLRELEWSKEVDYRTDPEPDYCPVCGGWKREDGHAPDCRLAALLKEATPALANSAAPVPSVINSFLEERELTVDEARCLRAAINRPATTHSFELLPEYPG